MELNTDDYLDQLQALLPRGKAWAHDAPVLTQLLQAAADELARIDKRMRDLVRESDPRTTTELLPDYERAFGLPHDCMPEAITLSERRQALVTTMVAVGGQSKAYFIELAKALGYEISITEFKPFVAGSHAGEILSNGDWKHAFQVNTQAVPVRHFVAGSGAGEPLRSWGIEILECVLKRLKPAHTTAVFAYGG